MRVSNPPKNGVSAFGSGLTLKPQLRCITIVRGRTGSFDASAPPRPFASRENRTGMDPKGRFIPAGNQPDYSTVRGLGLTDYPDLLLELILETHPSESVFRLKPNVVYYRKTAAQSGATGIKDIVATFTFLKPNVVPAAGSVEANAVYAIVPLRLSGLTAGGDYAIQTLASAAAWAPFPKMDETAQKALRKRMEDARLQTVEAMPFNLVMTLEETGDPGPFASFLADLVAGAGAETAAVLKQQLKQAPGQQSGP